MSTTIDALRNLGLKVNATVYEENQEFITNVIARRNVKNLLFIAANAKRIADFFIYYNYCDY